MDQFFENPFCDYGTIVHGERFIGRKSDLRVVRNRVLRPREPGNLAIIGDSRIGKSSLVYKAVIDRRNELVSNRVVPIWINVSNYDRTPAFFRSLVNHCRDKLAELNWLSPTIQRTAERSSEGELSWSEGYSRIQRFFEEVRQENIRIIFVLDEFDHARHLFQGDTAAFQGLRELAYRPEWRVAYIVISRRTIRDIEIQTQAISTLDGIFLKHYLGMFSEEDVEEYFDRLASVGISVDASFKAQVRFFCGGHPYLLELLGYKIVNLFQERRISDVGIAAQGSLQSFIDQYDRMIELLREEGNLAKLLQSLVGPVFDVRWTDVENLLKYGFIKCNEQSTYEAFSEHFHAYLKLVARKWDLWPIWRETEKAFRRLITLKMEEKYGPSWVNIVEKAKPNLKEMFDRCRSAQLKEERVFGDRSAKNLIDFTYPQDLFAIVFAEWSVFKDIIGKDKQYWGQRSQYLARIRNPLAHNRDEALYDYERQIAEGYCKEILTVVRQAKVI